MYVLRKLCVDSHNLRVEGLNPWFRCLYFTKDYIWMSWKLMNFSKKKFDSSQT